MHGTWPYRPTPRCAPAKGPPSRDVGNREFTPENGYARNSKSTQVSTQVRGQPTRMSYSEWAPVQNQSTPSGASTPIAR
jgi:hypothetical protein